MPGHLEARGVASAELPRTVAGIKVGGVGSLLIEVYSSRAKIGPGFKDPVRSSERLARAGFWPGIVPGPCQPERRSSRVRCGSVRVEPRSLPVGRALSLFPDSGPNPGALCSLIGSVDRHRSGKGFRGSVPTLPGRHEGYCRPLPLDYSRALAVKKNALGLPGGVLFPHLGRLWPRNWRPSLIAPLSPE